MTTEPSNGSANDDQRCYIERLEAIEKAARAIDGRDVVDLINQQECVVIRRTRFDALRVALEANR